MTRVITTLIVQSNTHSPKGKWLPCPSFVKILILKSLLMMKDLLT